MSEAGRVAPQRFGWLPGALLLVACGQAIFLALTLPFPRVFFSGDGGLKWLMVRQHAEQGLHLDLRLQAAPWVQALWEQGLYPFGSPFVYRLGEARVIEFGPLFAALVAPFYRLLGDPGLYVWPVAGACATFGALLWLGRRLALGPLPVALALGLAAFASPLSLYAALFWEHAPATGLLSLSLAALCAGGRVGAVAAGLLAGIGGALRPEASLLALLLFSLLAVSPCAEVDRRRAGLALGALLLCLAVGLLVNQWLYGTPLGLHARQEAVDRFGPLRLLSRLVQDSLVYFPATLLLPLVLLVRGPGVGLARRLGLTCALFLAAAALLLPAPGGKQWGSRYLLVMVPHLALLLSLVAARLPAGRLLVQRAALALLALSFAAGLWVNTVVGQQRVGTDYRARVTPLLELLGERAAQGGLVVAVTHQWIAQDLATLLPETPLFRLQGVATGLSLPNQDADLVPLASARRLARGLVARGAPGFLLVAFAEQRVPGEIRGDGAVTRFSPLGRHGAYQLFAARVEAELGTKEPKQPGN